MPGRLVLIALLLLGSGCFRQQLVTGLSEQEAQEIAVLLRSEGISAVKSAVIKDQEEVWEVSVRGGEGNLFLASRVLQENGLPRPRTQGLADVFADGGLIPTASQEKAKLILGLSGELTRTLESLPGVIDARVHVVLPDESPLIKEEQRRPTTASALVKYRGDQLPLSESEVKALLSKGIEGLTGENVAVVFKQIQTTPVNRSDMDLLIGYPEVTAAAVVVMILTTIVALVLAVRTRRQARHIEVLQLKSAGGAERQLQSG